MREWLKDYRKKKGLSAAETAKECGISKSYYEKIEAGARNLPVHTAKKIGTVLQFDWQKFYQEREA